MASGADHAGHHGTAVLADADGEPEALLDLERVQRLAYVHRESGSRLRMVRARLGDAGADPVSIADGPDLLQAVPLHQRVERGEHPVEEPRHPVRGEGFGKLREVHQVREEKGYVRVAMAQREADSYFGGTTNSW